jgi:hypothetical protein
MTRLADLCRYVRSKNAGPFWITVDLFFDEREKFDRCAAAGALQPAALATLFAVPEHQVKRFLVSDLMVLKISYPRQRPQGGVLERDMHGGQQYVRLLDLEV